MPDLASPHMTFDEIIAWAMEAELMGESRSGAEAAPDDEFYSRD